MRLAHWLGLIGFGLASTVTLAQPERVERLEGLCRVWGVVKYFHPAMAREGVYWDQALLDAIPLAEKAETADDYRAAMDTMLKALGDPATRAVQAVGPSLGGEPSGPASIEWSGPKDHRIATISARNWTSMASAPNAARGGVLTPLFEQCGEAKAIILDLRRSSPAESPDRDFEAFTIAAMLRADAPGLVGGTLTLSASRSRMHSGYSPQTGQTSGGYFSGFQLTQHTVATSAPSAATGKRLVVLTGDTSRGIAEILGGLQSAGAILIHEGDPGEAFNSGSGYQMSIALGVRVQIRTSELVNADGTIGIEPADVLPPGLGPDIAMISALDRASRDGGPMRQRTRTGSGMQMFDNAYAAEVYPNRELRLLALFRLWNVMHYFFPYHEHTDKPWDATLAEFIPKFEEAKDAAEYGLVIREMTARLQDSHVGASGGEAMKLARERLGAYMPPVAVQPVRGQPVIMKVLDEDGTEGARAGDTILEIDGKPVESVRESFARYTSASTPQAMRRRTDMELLRGQKDTPVLVTVDGVDGAKRTITLKRTTASDEVVKKVFADPEYNHPKHEVFTVLPEGYGYFDLVALAQRQVRSAFEKVKDTPALIMDMRGYPKGTAWEICSRLTSTRMNMAKFRRPYWTTPDPDEHSSYGFDQPIEPSPLWKYTGKVVVLIDAGAVSQSEHSCLGFEGAAKGRITFIGSPTTGANGDVTSCVLPGGVQVRFSGHDVRHADGRPLQRVGIKPDIAAEPTVKGLLEGKDEVLEAAIKHLKGS